MTKKFTEEDCEELVFEDMVSCTNGENRRWMRGVTTIVEQGGKFYSINWDEALTENGDHVFWDQDAPEVHEVERTIKKMVWESVC